MGDIPRKSGIYQIRNLVNGKVYVGSAVNLQHRRREHRSDLRNGNHHSIKLQRAYNKYGESSFAFEILEIRSCRRFCFSCNARSSSSSSFAFFPPNICHPPAFTDNFE